MSWWGSRQALKRELEAQLAAHTQTRMAYEQLQRDYNLMKQQIDAAAITVAQLKAEIATLARENAFLKQQQAKPHGQSYANKQQAHMNAQSANSAYANQQAYMSTQNANRDPIAELLRQQERERVAREAERRKEYERQAAAARQAAQPLYAKVLGPVKTLAEAKEMLRKLAKTAHPDHGGSTEKMSLLNQAMADAKRALAHTS